MTIKCLEMTWPKIKGKGNGTWAALGKTASPVVCHRARNSNPPQSIFPACLGLWFSCILDSAWVPFPFFPAGIDYSCVAHLLPEICDGETRQHVWGSPRKGGQTLSRSWPTWSFLSLPPGSFPMYLDSSLAFHRQDMDRALAFTYSLLLGSQLLAKIHRHALFSKIPFHFRW